MLIIVITSDHDFAHVTTAKLSWRVQNCDDLVGIQIRVKWNPKISIMSS